MLRRNYYRYRRNHKQEISFFHFFKKPKKINMFRALTPVHTLHYLKIIALGITQY